MEIKKTRFSGLVEILPATYNDSRGYFRETFNQQQFLENTLETNFVQDNESFSWKGILRGLHYQKTPHTQGKLVRVISGKVQDVVVDLRPKSPTFRQWMSFILDAHQGKMVYVPEGFAHGFLALEDSIFSYKCTSFYHKSAESGIFWNDPTLNIDWVYKDGLTISDKDAALPLLKDTFIPVR